MCHFIHNQIKKSITHVRKHNTFVNYFNNSVLLFQQEKIIKKVSVKKNKNKVSFYLIIIIIKKYLYNMLHENLHIVISLLIIYVRDAEKFLAQCT